METPENLTVTSANSFKERAKARTQGTMLKLTSGDVIRVARPSVNTLIATGQIPADVAAIMLGGTGDGKTLNSKQFAKLLELQKAVAKAAVIEPKIVDSPDYDAGEIAIDDLDDTDLTLIMQYVQSGVTELATFRSE